MDTDALTAFLSRQKKGSINILISIYSVTATLRGPIAWRISLIDRVIFNRPKLRLSGAALTSSYHRCSSQRRALASALTSFSHKMAETLQTVILPCDVSSISFEERGEEVIPIISSNQTRRALEEVSSALKHDLQPVAFPTETVYGLGGLALQNDAILRIFSTKGRPADNPLIVHISSLSMLKRILPPSYTITPLYLSLINSFWPGPLTLLFPSSSLIIPTTVTAGHETLAIRMPSHPVARALISLCDEPLAAPSANSSGRPSPTRAEHVYKDLKGKIKYILDGGPAQIGLESTVVDGLGKDGHLRVLRPGGITVEQLESVVESFENRNGLGLAAGSGSGLGLGLSRIKVLVYKRDYKDEGIEVAPTTPGMKYRHYAPSAPVILLVNPSRQSSTTAITQPSIENIQSFLSSLSSHSPRHNTRIKLGLLLTEDSPYLTPLTSALSSPVFNGCYEYQVQPLGASNRPHVTAQRLFGGLLTLDNEGVDVIIIESISETHEGLAIMNRVHKAAGEIRRVTIE